MSTLGIVAIIVGALIVLAILLWAVSRARRRREVAQIQTEATHEDAQHHRERAEERRTEAATAQERARRAEVEAELDEERAGRRQQEAEGQR